MDPVAPASGGSLATVDPDDGAPTGAPSTTGTATPPERDLARPAAVLAALLAFTVPLASATLVWAPDGAERDWTRRITTAPFDVVLLVIAGFVLLHAHLLVDLFRRRAVAVASGLYAVWFAAAFAANPSPLGVNLALRLLAGLAVIAVVGEAVRTVETRRLLFGAIAAAGALQAVLALVQAARGEAFGVELLDYRGPLYPFGSSLAGRGGLTHPYHLAVFLVLAQGAALLGLRHAPRNAGWRPRVPWLVAMAVLGAGIGVTYTRSGAIGQVALVVCLLLGRRDRAVQLAAVGCLALGLAVGGLGFGDGWLARAGDTTGEQGATADSSRSVRLREAAELIEDEPVLGVGPGRYVEAVAETEREEYLPAHNLVAHEAAELGVVGGLAALGLLGLLGLRVLRGGSWTGAVALPMVPFLLLDAYPYVFATGLAISALWLGLVRASLEPADEGPT